MIELIKDQKKLMSSPHKMMKNKVPNKFSDYPYRKWNCLSKSLIQQLQKSQSFSENVLQRRNYYKVSKKEIPIKERSNILPKVKD